MVGFTDTQVPEEYFIQGEVVVLSGMDQDMFNGLVEPSDDPGESDELGPGTDNGHDLQHRGVPPRLRVAVHGASRRGDGAPDRTQPTAR